MPHLLLLHGALGSAATLYPLQQLLAPYYSVHTLNFRGHGGTVLPEESFSIEAFAEDTLRYIEEQKLQEVDIFGFSMGGYVALYLALHQPAHIGRVFTLATKFAWSPETAAKEVKMLQPQKLEEKVPAFAATLAARHSPTDWRKVMLSTADMMQNLGEQPLLTAATLAKIDKAVRVSVGDRDNMVSIQETAWAFQHLPDASLLVLPDARHPLEQTDLQRLQWEIRQFFGGPAD